MKKFLAICLLLSGCSSQSVDDEIPQYSFAYSEYPSWSAFGVAAEIGLIDAAAGKQGEIEKKWNVDIVLDLADYDACITKFSNNSIDAACLTNIDTLPIVNGRHAVAVLPTSTSVGGDACIAVGINGIEDLKSQNVYGLERSVSQYAFERNLELAGLNKDEFKYTNMDPAAAAMAMETNQNGVNAIVVWNPFALNVLRKRTDSKVVFDSSALPEEIVDCVMVGQDVLSTPEGKRFASAICDTYYEFNKRLNDPAQRDQLLIAIGAKFSKLGLEDMKLVVQQTRFYDTPAAALALLNSDVFKTTTMERVADFCVNHDMLSDKTNLYGFNDPNAKLNFSDEYIRSVK